MDLKNHNMSPNEEYLCIFRTFEDLSTDLSTDFNKFIEMARSNDETFNLF